MPEISKKSIFSIYLNPGETHITILPVNNRGYIPKPLSLVLIICYILLLATVTLLFEAEVTGQIISYIAITLILIFICFFRVRNEKRCQKQLSYLAKNGHRVSALVIRKEVVPQVSKQLISNPPSTIISFKYQVAPDQEEILGTASVTSDQYDYLQMHQSIVLRVSSKLPSVAALERDITRHLAFIHQ